VNVSHAQLHECVFPNSNLHTAQWARAKITGGAKVAKPFKSLGFACSEVRSLGLVEGLKQAGYSCAEAKQAGYVEGLKQAGYSCAEAKQAGYVEGLKQAGYSCAEAKQAGYVEGLKQAGYSCAEAKQAGYTPHQCHDAGFTFQDGRAAGYLGDERGWSKQYPQPEHNTWTHRYPR